MEMAALDKLELKQRLPAQRSEQRFDSSASDVLTSPSLDQPDSLASVLAASADPEQLVVLSSSSLNSNVLSSALVSILSWLTWTNWSLSRLPEGRHQCCRGRPRELSSYA